MARHRPEQEGGPPSRGAGFRVFDVARLAIGLIQPAPYNPRKIGPRELEALKTSLRQHGFVENLVVQRASRQYGENVLVAGHQRLKAAREIAVEDNVEVPALPCIVLDIDDRTAKRLNVALNNVGGEFDAQMLAELLEDVNAEAPIGPDEVLGMGFDDDEFAGLLHLNDPPEPAPDEGKSFGRSVTFSLAFRDTTSRDAVKAKLEERAKKQRQSTGEVVLGLLARRAK